jgi:hypothetical protein
MWSPIAIVRSLGELLLRAALSLWAILTVLVAGVAAILERVAHNAHISDRLWFRIAVVGAIVSVVWAYHRTRIERDRARAAPIAPSHGDELTQRVRLALARVRDRLPAYYNDAAPGGPADRASFCAHYPARGKEIERWNEQIGQEQLYGKIKEEIRREATSDEPDAARIDPSILSVQMVVDCMWGWLLKTAGEGKLAAPAELRWQHHDLPDRWDLELEGECVGTLPPGSPEDLEEPVQAARAQVFALAEAIRGWADARKITENKEAAERLRGPLMHKLDLDLRAAEDLRRSDACEVCQHHRVVHGPSLPRWLRRTA